MPFERYLRADDHAIADNSDYAYYYQDHRNAPDDADCHYAHDQHSYSPETTHYHGYHPHGVHFQIPQFMRNGPPILAPGGGAEVLPAGLLGSGSDSLASSWISNNGFAPFHSALISRQITSGSTPDSASTATSYHAFPSDGSRFLSPSFPPRFATSVDPRQRSLPEPLPSLGVVANYIPNLASSPPSATSSALSSAVVLGSASSVPVPVPSALGLPVYSASGFDVLSILSRVVNRLNPTVQLGPVDLSCSFVIVDVRRYDSPIVYASPTFCHLTGYSDREILGRNCRFLQSPTGRVPQGELRRFASPDAVSYMRKLLLSSKECQTTLINYRKGGQAFINLVTVIPLRGGVHNTPEEAEEVVYHVGFQVDLTEQPTRILDKLRDGSYYSANFSSWGKSNLSGNGTLPAMGHGLGQLAETQNMTNIGTKGGRHGQMMSIAASKELRNLIADTTFTNSVSISTGTNMSGPAGSSSGSAEQGSDTTTPLTMFVSPPPNSASIHRTSASGNTMAGSIPVSLSPSLSLLLLEFLPDFVLVLSLKGAFLYVAPSVRLVLGYEPQELVGRSISDVCHPADLVPLMRELKEGSVSGLGVPGTSDAGLSIGTTPNHLPKPVDLLFRALPKASTRFSKETNDVSAEQGNFHSPQMSSSSTSQSPPSSGTLCPNDPADETAPPYVWLECRGRLHVEPGKGRKAIILSGRPRWMPVVRWSSIDQAGGVGNVRRHGEDVHGGPMVTASRPSEAAKAPPFGPSEFWALLSTQGTFLVASASVRDVLGWGTSEMIGRNIWSMVKDNRNGMRECVEAELTKFDVPEATNMADSPPTIVTTSLVHKESYMVPIRLIFYRTPRSHKYAPPTTSRAGVSLAPLMHPLNNPLCPIVCQATVLSNVERQSKNITTDFGPSFGNTMSQAPVQVDAWDDTDKSDPSIHSSSASLFEELATTRGTSWQYELQQLKFANQRLHEELQALEGVTRGAGTESPSSTGHATTTPLVQQSPPSSSTESSVPQQLRFPQTKLHYTPLMHSALSTSISLPRLPNNLHEQDPPPSEWSSLTGANGQVPNPLKRSWHSEDGPTT